jgi:beta-1,4-mannosyltransferase
LKPKILIHPPYYHKDTDNPYLRPLFTYHDDKIVIKSFSWKLALFSSYRVLHIHWIEHLVSAPSPLKSLSKALLSFLLLCRVSVSGISVVNTRHNLIPHSRINNPLSLKLFSLWEKKISTHIVMNRFEISDEKKNTHLIPHPVHPVHPFQNLTRMDTPLQTETERPYFIHFGRIDKDRLVIELIRNFGTSVQGSDLLVVGEVPDSAYLDHVLLEARLYSNVFIKPYKVASNELDSYIQNSSGVIGPLNHYHNSGVLFHALAHMKPILTRENATSRELQCEVLHSLIYVSSDPCSPNVLTDFVASSKGIATIKETNLLSQARQPIEFFQRHADLYRKVALDYYSP